MEKNETRMMVYDVDGHQVKLSPSIVKQYLVSGGGNATDQEIMMFMALCQHRKLDPFIRDAYLVKYGSNAPAAIVASKDSYMKRATADPSYNGYDIEVTMNKDGKFADKVRCRVYRKGIDRPAADVEVYHAEYNTGKSSWASKPVTMLRKVAIVQAMREAFPSALGGMYSEDEMPVGRAVGEDLPRTVVTHDKTSSKAQQVIDGIKFEPAPELSSVSAIDNAVSYVPGKEDIEEMAKALERGE